MKSFSWKEIRSKIKNMKRSDWLIVLLVGVLLLIMAIPVGDDSGKNSENTSVPENTAPEQSIMENDYKAELEEQLTELLSSVSGVGKVKVMITLKNDGEQILDKDISQKEGSTDSNTVVYRYADEEGPYVVQSTYPQVEGVVIVAEGGDNAIVCTNISEAVKSLFPIEAHKITIVKMSVAEGSN